MNSELQQLAEVTAWLTLIVGFGVALLAVGVVVELIGRIKK